MASRVDLHNELLKFMTNVYFQPPSSIVMSYPCIVYRKSGKTRLFADNELYRSDQEYTITLMEKNPDSVIADTIEEKFPSCVISQYYTMDNINHTVLNLYY